MPIVLIAVLVALGLLIIWLIFTYNGLITLRNRTNEAWSDIDVQLKRRYNLIPNLVETVKGYAKHESDVFTNVTKARTAAMAAQTPAEHAEAENMLSDTLKSLFAVAENYPALQASDNFLHLQNELTDAEDKIEAARRFFNGNVRDFNTKMQVFPTNLVAGVLGFKKFEFFEIAEDQRNTPKVNF